MSGSSTGWVGQYSEVADQQLDDLEARDPELYSDVMDVCEAIFASPARAQGMSAAVQTTDGIVFRLAVPGRYPYKVFWTSDGPRIEAIFPYP